MQRTLLFDSNVLLFYLVTQVDLSLITSFKRVSAFKLADVQLLRDLVEPFSGFMTTPHVLTEVSNLVDQAKSRRLELIDALRTFAGDSEEHFEPARVLMERQEFASLGLTDTALSALADHATVATMDHELCGRVRQAGVEAVDFHELRPVRWR